MKLELNQTNRQNIEDIYPLSPMQEGMLFESLYAPDSGAYFEQLSCILTGNLDVKSFEKAWQQVVAKYSVFRTAFVWESLNQPIQIVYRQVNVKVETYNWRNLSAQEQQKELETFLEAERQKGFQLSQSPLMRLHLIQLERNKYQFVWCYHHLLLDGWSSSLVFNDLLDFYQAISQGEALPFKPTPSYRNYIAWIQQQDKNLAAQYWRKNLQGFTTPTPLTVDKPLSMRSQQNSGDREQQINLTASATAAVVSFARQHQLTLSNLVQATWGLLLSRYSQETDVLFGATVSGRPPELAGVESMVGLFINTLPVRVQISEHTELLGLLKNLQTQQVESEQYSYSSLVEIQGLSDVPRGTSLFESIVVFENYPVDTAGLETNSDFSVSNFRVIEQTNYPLTVIVAPGEQLLLKVMYDASRFEDGTISRMLGHFVTLLEAIVADPQQKISHLPILTAGEQQQLLVEWNDTEIEYLQEKCVCKLFEQQVELTPDAVAVIFENQQLTYRELNSRANQLAHYLRSLGVKPDTLVGICVERSLEMVIGILGILKAGGAYVPLDPEYPQERLSFMLEDAAVSVLLTQQKLVEKLPQHKAQVIYLDTDWSHFNQMSQDNLISGVQEHNLGYVIYTSGSTGQPKGVAMTQLALCNLILWQQQNSPMSSKAVKTLQFAPISFDVSFQEMFSTWFSGGTLLLIDEQLRREPLALLGLLQEQAVERLFVPFVALQQLAEVAVSSNLTTSHLREIITAGEQLQITPAISQWLSQLNDCTLHNHYGPSESHVIVTYTLIDSVDTWPALPPIGRPIANTQIYILDKYLQPVPIGVPGELHIGGVSLARGYLNRSELTKEKFIPNPFDEGSESRLYKTGDLARYLSDGSIEYIGRIDNQVKIRGFRIELGEIESVLSQYEQIQANCVIVREDTPTDTCTELSRSKRLVAYIVPQPEQTPTVSELRQFLKSKLPEYMVPTAFVSLESLPLTPSGKVNRRALPAPQATSEQLEKYVAPRTPIEEILANIWQQVLKLELIGRHDNFFELGGHSLLATQLVSRVRSSLKVELPLRSLFAAPTIAQLAQLIGQIQQQDLELAAPPIIKRTENTDLPLSYAQQRLWFLDQFEPNSSFYNIPIGLRLVGIVNISALEQSFREIIHRHEALRTNFVVVDGQPRQIIRQHFDKLLRLPSAALRTGRSAQVSASQGTGNTSTSDTVSLSNCSVHRREQGILSIVDLQHLSATEKDIAAQELAQQQAIQPFDLANDVLIRATLVLLSDTEQWLLVCMHHVVSDGWSMGVFVDELTALYNAYAQSKSSPLLPLQIQYADFAIWQRQWLQGEVLNSQLSYWQQQLANAPTFLPLPTDRPRPALQTFNGAYVDFALGVELTQQLEKLSQQQGVTLFMTLLAAYNTLLYRYTGQEDILVGTPIANRDRSEIEGLIGFFVNTLVMRTNLAQNPSFNELLPQVRETALSAYAHQDLPFEMLVEALQPERGMSHTPLFQVMFSLQNTPVSEFELSGLSVSLLPTEISTAKFDMTLVMENTATGLIGWWEYNTDLFDSSTIERMMGHFVTLLEAIVTNPQEKISQLPMLTASEQQQLLVEWNNTKSHYPSDKCIHQLFEEQVERTPDALAVVFENQQLTYSELNSRANQLAHHLQSLGVKPDTLVGICVERSLEMVVGMLGILKAGGAYLPLDPEYPTERLAFMLDDTQLSVILTQEKLVNRLGDRTIQIINLDSNWDTISQQPQHNLTTSIKAQDLAYVMYTSGSTGQPKGVSIIHQGVVRLVKQTEYASFNEKEVFLQLAPIAFDAATFEIWGALLNGAKLVIYPANTPTIDQLGKVIEQHQVTILWLTAGLFHLMVDENIHAFKPLRQLIAGGDILSVSHVQKFLQTVENCQLINGYGPTENTTFTCCYQIPQSLSSDVSVPIGRPIANTQVYILDKNLQPLPIGVPGELHIGGAGLARDYFNRPELTQEKFIPNPFEKSKIKSKKSKLYKTGDLVRYLPDGNIQYLGRIDNQVKIRGFRIELGEIEALLSQHNYVQTCCVIVREDTPGDKRLVAYVVARPDSTPTTDELRQFVKAKLPEYMIPTAFVILESLPLTQNGKVDRRALPTPDLYSSADKYVAPRTPIEELLAQIWAQILKVSQVGIDDNFFELGGHSLLATQLVSRIRNVFNVELPLRSLFAAPTIAQLATLIAQVQQQDLELNAPPIIKRAENTDIPLSFAQQRLWFLDQFEPNSSFYNIPIGLRLVGNVNIFALEQSFQEIIHRHEALRTNFVTVNGQPTQVIQTQLNWKFTVVDLQHLPVTEQETAAQELAQQQATQPFDLANDVLIRATLVLLSDTEQWLLICMHHVVSDGWSMGVFVDELTALYNAYAQGQSSPLPPLPIQYADFAIWQRQWLQGEVLNSQLSYWQQQLANAPTFLPLPTDRPRPAVQTFNGAYQQFALSVELTQKLEKLSQQQGVTLFMTLLGAYNTLLYRYTGQEDILVGTPIANRDRSEIEGLIGFFVNTLVMRTNLAQNPSFNELLPRIREMALSAYAHQDLPFEMLVEALQPERDMSHTPLFQAMFALQNTPVSEVQLTGLTVSPLPIETSTAKFDITLVMENTTTGLVGWWNYNIDLFDSSTIARVMGHFVTLLEAIVANPGEHISQLPLLTATEQQQLLVEWNDTQVNYPQDKFIHQLFEEQVERTPNAVAVVFGNEQLTYQQLNCRANQLANYLQTLGVKPDTLVGICVERSFDMVVGLLGILKAGGAYVPIDPEYPSDRLSFMLADAQVLVLLTQQRLIEKLPQHQAQVVCLDTDWQSITQFSQEQAISSVQATNLAYVIYTSGSTGKPKGAMNTHQGIYNRLLWMQQAYQLTTVDAVLQKTPFSFDVSVWEFFWPLFTGARLVVAKPGGHRDSAYLVNLIQQQQVTTLHFVPSMLRAFLEEQGVKNCQSLKRVICSGEALLKDLQERFFASLDCELHNLYGPTEAAIDVTYWQCQPDSNLKIVPIGQPIGNTQIYILDSYLQPVPIGVPGELHIGGVGLARGYLNRPDLTNEKFIPSPFNNGKLYKTGDLARYLPDGNIEYLGRIDHQVKLRGFRIELGEIEAALTQHPAVGETVVIAREDDPENNRLVAYFVPNQDYAFPVLQLLRFQNEGLLNQELLYELPNGMVIAHLNKNETEFVYKELWEEQAYLKHGITVKPGDCIFDVGANIGLFTLFVGQMCKDISIYAFEPIPPVFDLLRINAEGYGLNVKLFNIGLSSQTKSDTFTFYPQASLISGRFADIAQEGEVVKSLLLKQQNAENQTAVSIQAIDELLAARLHTQQFTCYLRTISDVISEHGVEKIDLLKIDVEKSERDVLSGIQPQDWPKIQQIVIEVHDLNGRLEEIATLLKEHGYDLTIEEDSLLENTGLYNIYARRPSINQYPQEELGSSLVSDAVKQTWSNSSLLVSDVRSFLQKQLPEYMIPQAFVLLESLPLSPNGKVDRRALPAPELDKTLREKFVAPRTPIEEMLAQIWAQVLKVEPVGIYDNFFQLGGHSLLATQLVSRIRNIFQVELLLREFFAAPTVAELAHLIEQLQQQDSALVAPPILPRAENADLSLSFAQQRLWFLDQFESNSSFYNLPIGLRLVGSVNISALEQSLGEIIHRHEALRTNFVTVDGQARQVIRLQGTGYREQGIVCVVDLQHLPLKEQETAAQELVQQQASQPFDLANDALIRAALLVLSDTEHWLVVSMHHIVSDGWSMGVFVSELTALYNAYSQGQQSPLMPLPIQYADFALWQRQWLQGEVLNSQLSYWKQQLADAPTFLPLPTDRPRPAVQTFNGASVEFSLSVELTQQLEKLSQQQGVTLFMTLLAAYNTLLYRYTGQEDILVGTPIANRDRSEIEGLIGFFVNTLVMRTNLAQNPSFSELLPRVRETALSAYAHQDLPFEMLVEVLQPERDMSHTPLFQVMFVLQNTPVSEFELTGLTISDLFIETSTVKFDLTLVMENSATGLIGWWQYNTDLFDSSTIERMMGHFVTLLEAIVTNPQEKISQLPMLTASEKQQLLIEWNDTAVDYPSDKCIHQLFEEQAELRPNAVAVVFENQHLTYRALNSRANELAHYLQTLGVQPDTLVGICVERSLEMVVGLLGILKAGGAYLPLDPEYPQERLSFMLEDAQVGILLTQEKLLDKLPVNQAKLVFIDEIWSEIDPSNQKNPTSEVTASHLANVIYTSGSTGKPKGVMVEHKGLYNLAQAQIQTFSVDSSSRVLQFASLSFDACIWEILMTWVSGGTIYLGTKDALIPGAPLIERFRDYGITHVTLPPSALAVLPTEELPSLQTIIVAGEACSVELIKTWSVGRNFFNAYGPTEASVCATTAKCTPVDNKVTIGRPIANTQVYILDSQLQPVPIGVPGELYISGAGVARGYLNRPELTQEKFIPNPFEKSKVKSQKSKGNSFIQHSALSTQHSALLYKTGDLARYLPDGNIEYLGRIDNQVKIRGFRIELAEIESILSQHPGVRESVVVAREDIPGEKRLVAYFAPHLEQNLTINQLRIFLQEKLPQYMVPSAFVSLESLPLSPNGKVDRKALPVPDSQNTQSVVSFVAPRTHLEKVLAEIWADVLHLEQVGVFDNFFDLGGHSLTTIRVMSQVNETFHMKLPLRHLFTAPTIAELARTIESTFRTDSTVSDNEINTLNLQAEVVLDETIKPGNLVYQPVNEPKAILLTGATGFVGAFLLAELLQQTQADIYCLVRGANLTAGKQRLEESLKAYLVWEKSFNSRIIPVLGDLSQPLLGLTDEQFHFLAEKIDWIYHNGALVNNIYPYALFKAANVRGTEEVLRLASHVKIKPVHFVSTLSVFSSDEYFKLGVVEENDPLENYQGLMGGYTQSKWVAEKIVMMARDRGLPCSIYRLGRVTWHSQTGVWNSNDLFYRFIKGCIQLKTAPEMDSMVEITPVDYLAKVLVHLSQQPKSLGKAFHLVNSHSAPWSQLINCIHSLGYPLQQIPYENWQAELLRNTQISTDNALYSFVSLAAENPSSNSKAKATSSLKFDCQNTLNELENSDITWPEVDDKLLQAFFAHFNNETLDKKI